MAREEVYRDPGRMKALKEELPKVSGELDALYAEWESWLAE
jgi:hypothetical protein